MKRILLIGLLIGLAALTLAAFSPAVPSAFAEVPAFEYAAGKPADKNVSEVVFSTNMHCDKCVNKLNENLSFLKGVKDLRVSLEDQTITIKYDNRKTDEKALADSIKKLGYKAEKVQK